MSSIGTVVARALRGPYRDWELEVAQRYQPVVRIVRTRGLAEQVVEVGSGSLGISPYLRTASVGVDMGFAEPHRIERLRKVCGSALQLPFSDESCACVVSVDMLEHVPPAERPAAVGELMRVTRSLLVLGVPEGAAAEGHDKRLARAYRDRRGEDYPFFQEHLEHGLPRRDDVERWMRVALEASGRRAKIRLLDNSNLRVRESLMRLWIRRRVVDRLLGIALTYAHPIFTRLNFGRCYRVLAVVEFDES